MAAWQQFLVIAGLHFLALLSPGPDFFLIVRSALVNGTRVASGVCVGIALANGFYIALAISGVAALQEVTGLISVLAWGGCAYLAWLGWRFLGVRGAAQLPAGDGQARPGTWGKECRVGFLSGILNPKNSLFYASLFSLGFGPTPPCPCNWPTARGCLVWCCCGTWVLPAPPVIRRWCSASWPMCARWSASPG